MQRSRHSVHYTKSPFGFCAFGDFSRVALASAMGNKSIWNFRIGISVSFNRSICCLQINVRANTWSVCEMSPIPLHQATLWFVFRALCAYGMYILLFGARCRFSTTNIFVYLSSSILLARMAASFAAIALDSLSLTHPTHSRLIQLFNCLRFRPIAFSLTWYLHCTK